MHFLNSNERKWFITQESVERAIAEEKAKAERHSGAVPNDSEQFGNVPNRSERAAATPKDESAQTVARVKELEKEVMNLKITNEVKDKWIEQITKESESVSFGKTAPFKSRRDQSTCEAMAAENGSERPVMTRVFLRQG